MRYKGGKNGSGVYQRIISMMPPHDTYIEAFLGSGAILRRKKLAAKSLAFELNRETLAAIAEPIREIFNVAPGDDQFRFELFGKLMIGIKTDEAEITIEQTDAVEAIRSRLLSGSLFWGWNDPARTLIYLDPPYPEAVRSSKKKIYEFELMAEHEHRELLELILAVPCRVMISGYANKLYDQTLKGWRREIIPTVNRAGTRVEEIVWCNFPQPAELHDYRYLGTDFHDRLRIRRKADRWVQNLADMPANERYAVFGKLQDLRSVLSQIEAAEAATMQKAIERSANKAIRILSPKPTMPDVTPGELFQGEK